MINREDMGKGGFVVGYTNRLVPQGVRQKSKVKSQNEYTMSFPVVWNGLFISADLY
ncbi:hypothetical protein NIES806_32450 [Dolichospermum compactum NIES-806]|uniref:Uncharacterized protein n=1 Tax=Dolichospermum compactum NIES-806 TaxID=1973481 RepID=A0A1Z4V696_9CYAN|nr:hypothetical protein NIES806_32450 [Dolichospermum compactum NIES-806]